MRVIFPLKEIEDVNLGVMYLASALKQHGHSVEVIEAEQAVLESALSKNIPTVLAFSTSAFYADYYFSLNKFLKQRFGVFTVFGGAHATGKPEIIEEQGIDAVCIGEGEAALLELVDGLEKKQDVTSIRNMWIKEKGKIYRNQVRPLAADLDQLLFPDRSLFHKISPFYQERINVITSRGCAFSCPYCYNNTMARIYALEKNRYRRRSVENVLREIKEACRQQRVKFILFHDDIFILLPQWVKEFSERYSKEVGIPFSCYVRVDLITPEVVSYLRQAGCHAVSFGLETGDETVRTNVLHRPMDRDQIIAAASLLKKNGIRLRTTNMIGIPGGSLAGDLMTLKLNIECRVDYASVTMLSAYPNTEMADITQNQEIGWSSHVDSRLPGVMRFMKNYSLSAAGYYQRLAFSFRTPRFGYKGACEKQMIGNLHNIFGVIVGFPFLFPFVKLLLRLPPNAIFTYANFFWRHYCAYFRIYSIGGKSTIRSIMRYRQIFHKVAQH